MLPSPPLPFCFRAFSHHSSLLIVHHGTGITLLTNIVEWPIDRYRLIYHCRKPRGMLVSPHASLASIRSPPARRSEEGRCFLNFCSFPPSAPSSPSPPASCGSALPSAHIFAGLAPSTATALSLLRSLAAPRSSKCRATQEEMSFLTRRSERMCLKCVTLYRGGG